ncbi:uncharacterized protein LOC127791834 isoform X2 [Diospyros lotus]|uniref:uncharacterized protein LOC127791834 isoform X2 n=1 Tax=Diospyros lotus TaxID=55363 RepID=UPI002253AFF0|nr:uncharacterized protein LOC127791834 isoform X2 [Diospyros lotus]
MVIGRVLRSPTRLKDLCLILSSLFIFYLLLHHHPPPPPPTTLPYSATTSPTSLRHLLFSIAASSRSFPARCPYLRLWHRPNSTRTVVFLDRPISLSPSPSDTPVLLSAPFPGGPAARIARVVKETVLLNQSDVRWFVFGDDDTVFFTANLVRTLSRYDHDQWYYVGSWSESYGQNLRHSFEMAYGGGGFAISHSLARVLAGVLDSCLIRYAHLYGSDARVFSCLAELGVGLTHEPGFHQVDIRGDIFGLLSAHPLSPLLSLHHFEALEPIFPNMTRNQAFEHLFKAVNVDPGL